LRVRVVVDAVLKAVQPLVEAAGEASSSPTDS
jgi:hypothetical protein